MDKIHVFEERLNKAYQRFAPLAQRYFYTFSRPSVTAGSVPVVLFLGNHSSGKSSLLNWVLEKEGVQDTGVAPTDDGFTVLLYGETAEDVCGPAALARLPGEFKSLESLGPSFLCHLKIKFRPIALLKDLALVDSPGMIDSAEGTISRDYDFSNAVRRFALLADMIFFLFDPEKPGTTGETVDVFATSLRGCEFKLRVLLNKCDRFTSLYDFARTYGAVCWNLARVLKTKDLPKIYTTYSGGERDVPASSLDFGDFNNHRKEFLAILKNATVRRRDNIFAAAYTDFVGLSVRMAVVNVASSRIASRRFQNVSVGLLCALSFGGAVGMSMFKVLNVNEILSGCCGVLTACLVHYLSCCINRLSIYFLRRKLSDSVDQIYSETFRKEIAVGLHDYLSQTWDNLREETAEIVLKAPFKRPFMAEMKRRQLEAVAAELLDASRAFAAEKE